MEGIQDYKKSLISIGYSEEMAQRIAEGLVKALQPTNEKGDK